MISNHNYKMYQATKLMLLMTKCLKDLMNTMINY